MEIKVSITTEIVSFDTYQFQVSSPKEQDDEIEELEQRLVWPYELPGHTAAIRGPVSIWGTAG